LGASGHQGWLGGRGVTLTFGPIRSRYPALAAGPLRCGYPARLWNPRTIEPGFRLILRDRGLGQRRLFGSL